MGIVRMLSKTERCLEARGFVEKKWSPGAANKTHEGLRTIPLPPTAASFGVDRPKEAVGFWGRFHRGLQRVLLGYHLHMGLLVFDGTSTADEWAKYGRESENKCI